MPRVRLGVVLVVPEPVATEIQGLRRALGDPVLDRIMPHVTLVPPVNVRADAMGEALAVLRDAAAVVRSGPLRVELGPPRTFGPDSPTLYLPVHGEPTELDALHRLRAAAFVAPLHRSVDHEFVPHVTIAAELPATRLAAGIDALGDFRATFAVDAVTLLRFAAADDAAASGPRWTPAADVRLGPRAIVGRGGIELELTTSSMPDPEVRRLLAEGDHLDALGWFDRRAGGAEGAAEAVVVTARRRGAVVGVAWGRAPTVPTLDAVEADGEVAAVVVAAGAEADSVDRQLRLALESQLVVA